MKTFLCVLFVGAMAMLAVDIHYHYYVIALVRGVVAVALLRQLVWEIERSAPKSE